MFLNFSKLLYVYNFNSAKEMWDTEMIYEVSPSIEQERMNTRDKEDECFIHKYFPKFRNIINYIGIFVTNKCLRIKNWNKKCDPILKLKDESFCDLHKKSKKEGEGSRNTRNWGLNWVSDWTYDFQEYSVNIISQSLASY